MQTNMVSTAMTASNTVVIYCQRDSMHTAKVQVINYSSNSAIIPDNLMQCMGHTECTTAVQQCIRHASSETVGVRLINALQATNNVSTSYTN